MTRHLGASRKVCFAALISTFHPLPSHSPFHLFSSSLLVHDQTHSLHHLLFPLFLFSTRQQSQRSILVSAWGCSRAKPQMWSGWACMCVGIVPCDPPHPQTRTLIQPWIIMGSSCGLSLVCFFPWKIYPRTPEGSYFIHSFALSSFVLIFFFLSQHTEVSERMKR